jgi:DNA-directed RNA polymerase specialized sigma24 family protein
LTPSSGLSPGAKIEIGVGVSLGVTFAILFVLAISCIRRRRHRSEELQSAELPASTKFTSEFASDRTTVRAELNGSTPTELAGTRRAELDGSTHTELNTSMPVELGTINIRSMSDGK